MRTAKVLLLLLLVGAADARAQKLTIQGDRFAIDGTPKFLTFITYYGAMAAPNLAADLRFLKKSGFDGIRIWPLFDLGPQVLNADGSVRSDELSRLRFILDTARLEKIVVDLSFTHEHVGGMTAAGARTGITNLARELRSYDHILFDIQNERNVGDRRFMSESDVASIFASVKSVDPNRITTASNSPADDVHYATSFTARHGLDVNAYHEPRGSNWFELGQTQFIVSTLRSNGRPAYMQEPNTTRDDLFFYPNHDKAEYFQKAIVHNKLAGAAAWCFHSDVAINFNDGGKPFMEDRLREYAEPEWIFVTALTPRIVLRANNGVNYVVAEGGGGAGVRADRTGSGPGAWNVLTTINLSGGPLVTGDRIALQTSDGSHYLQAAAGGGGAVRASSTTIGAWETFTIEKIGSGMIKHGDSVVLRSDNGSYVRADGGGGGAVTANGIARGSWETFTVLFVPPYLQCAGDSSDGCT